MDEHLPAAEHPVDTLSIVIPVLNEAPVLAETLEHVRGNAVRGNAVREVLVVDGGSKDATLAIAEAGGAVVLTGKRGRSRQMHAGAKSARGEVLLFLHADTHLPREFDAAVLGALRDPEVVGGRFDLELQPSSPLLALTGTLVNLRSRWSGIATGDQALFVRRSVYEAMGGFELLPIMEDIAFTRALKRRGRVVALRERVITSSRRWRDNGVVRTILLMWTMRLFYFFGASPARLHRWYPDVR